MTATRFAPLLAALCALTAAGCKCEDEKPYTPFEVASTLPSLPSAPSAAPSVSAPTPAANENPTMRRAMKAPRDARTWKLQERSFEAPRGQVFSLGLTFANPSDTAATSFVAWTVRKGDDPAAPPAALWLYAGGEPQKLTALPGFVPTGPDCTLEAELSQTGPRTVTLDVSSRCTGRLVQRIPTRAVLVLDPSRKEPLLMGFRVAEPAPGESLGIAVDSRDADGDGRDDVSLRVTGGTQGPGGPSAAFVWLDRAAGRSRETTEPAASFARFVRSLETRAKSKKTASEVPRDVGDLRRLWASLCAESGTPRVFDFEGSPLPCGEASSIARALVAEIDAQLTLGHAFEALGALGRDGFYGARLGEKERRAVEERVRRAAHVVSSTVRGSFAAKLPKTSEPHFSPLWLDHQGRLWVRTADAKVVRSEPVGSAPRPEAPASVNPAESPDAAGPEDTAAAIPEAPPVPDVWPLRVEDPNGRIWVSAIPSCDRSEVQLGFVARDGRPLPPLPTTLLAPRPGNCKRFDAKPLIVAVPITWHGVDLESFVGGARFGAPAATAGSAARPGSPLSPDGRSLVLPSALGPMVLEGSRVTLWQGDATEGVEDCVVENGARLMACISSGRVVVLERGPEPTPEPPTSKAQKK